MKKVCMITHDSPYIDRRILLEAKSLIENGYNVTIIHPFGEVNSDFANVGINYISTNPNINIKNGFSVSKRVLRKILPQKIYESLKSLYFTVAKTDFIDYEKELKEMAIQNDYDIYVAHDLPALPIAHYASKIKSAKLVYDAHEFFTGQIALKGKRKKFFQELEKKLISDVDLMFTVNKDIAKLFEKAYNISNIQILLNSIEKKEVHKIDLHNKLNISKEKKIVLYQGGFLEDRNLEVLVKSAQYLSEKIVLVMLGYSFLEKKLKNIAINAQTINKKVFFLDRVPQKELLNYTAGADVGIIPYPAIDLNTTYCTPNKMFEFISAGIPIIANDELITVKNIFKEHKIGKLISFKNSKTIAEGLNNIVLQDDLKNIKLNLKNAKQYFSWESQEQILIDAFKEL